MTREAWERTITDSAGNVLTGVQVSVFQSNGTTVATIYGQQSGGAPIANPFNTGVQTSAKFYADPGLYVVRVLKDGLTKEFTDVSIADKAIRDDLGTAAYLTATTSPTDNTPGRALRGGDLGLGRGPGHPLAAFAADLNDLTTAGLYYTNTGVNRPAGAPAGQVLVGATGGSNNNIFQLYFQDISATPSMHLRIRNNGVWQGWQNIYSSGNAVGPVSFSGGVNTGAIIERGNNTNGEFVRFADGTQICTFARSAPIAVSQYGTISGLFAGSFSWSFPAAFVGGFITCSGAGGDQAAVGWVSATAGSGIAATVTYLTPTANITQMNVTLMAVGRWR